MLAPVQPAPLQGVNPNAVFNALDSNHDGSISREEFIRAGLGAMQTRGEPTTLQSSVVTPPTAVWQSSSAISQPAMTFQSSRAMLPPSQPALPVAPPQPLPTRPVGVQLPGQAVGVQLLQPPPLVQQPPFAVQLQQPLYRDTVVDGGIVTMERPVRVKVQAGDPRAVYQSGRAGAASQGMYGGRTEVNRLDLPKNDTGLSDEKYLEMMASKGNYGASGFTRPQQFLGFPYHDPAYGCHYRNLTMNDEWDEALKLVEPDEEPPLEKLMRAAKAEIALREEQKRNRRKLEHLEHKALEKLKLDFLDDGCDEVEGPMPFRDLGRPVHHPAMVTVDPEPEYHGLAWWLA